MKRKLAMLLLVVAAFFSVKAQEVAIKTNLLYDAAANVNVGLEFGLAPKWTLDLSADYNGWTIRNHKWKHWFVQPEARYWFCDRFAKGFLAFHAIGGQYNVGNIPHGFEFLGTDLRKLADNRYQGWGVGGGIGVGYDVILGKHWNLEFEIAVGYVYLQYDIYKCQDCGRKLGEGHHNYYGPTKAAINLVYLF